MQKEEFLDNLRQAMNEFGDQNAGMSKEDFLVRLIDTMEIFVNESAGNANATPNPEEPQESDDMGSLDILIYSPSPVDAKKKPAKRTGLEKRRKKTATKPDKNRGKSRAGKTAKKPAKMVARRSEKNAAKRSAEKSAKKPVGKASKKHPGNATSKCTSKAAKKPPKQ